ncbi:MAG: glycosyltransferase family 1 protein [Saprospiraceae bacterium]
MSVAARRRIAILADPLDNQKGGVHTYTRELVHGLTRFDEEFEWIIIREKKDPRLEHVRQIAIPNVRIGLGLAALRLFLVVPLVLRFLKVDAVIEPAHFGPFNLPDRIKRVTVIHDLTPILFPQYHRFHSQWLQNVFLRSILRRAALIVTNSRHTARDVARVYPSTANKVVSILLGYNPQFTSAPEPRVTDHLRLPERFWLSVGTIEPRKNLVRLLEAYARFRQEQPDHVALVMVGQRGWKSALFDQALAEHPFREDIILTGYVDDGVLNGLYHQAIALVYPSEYEGFGLPVLEAFACGCPVICSNTSSLPEVGGEVARYVHPERTDELLRQMNELYALDPTDRKVLAQRALDWASSFGWDKHVRLFHEELQKLIFEQTNRA